MAKYLVSECIGRGGMAEVFLARQEGIGGFEKLVALKRIYPHLIHDKSFVEMFLEEARIAASLQHPKIVDILDIESDKEGFFIVMEYLAGEALNFVLQDLEQNGGHIPPEIVCRIGSDIATGLHAAHTASDSDGHLRPVVHRDVTPSNIFVTFSGDVKVLDFGVAKATKRSTTTDKSVLKGKTGYLSPELINGKGVDARADIFQLGIVVHEMLTGKRLFVGGTVPEIIEAISESKVSPPSSSRPGLPRSLDEVVLKALSLDPDNRYQSAEDFAQALDVEGAALGEPVSERALGKWMSSTFPKRVKQKLRSRQTALDNQKPFETNTPEYIAENSATVSQPTVKNQIDIHVEEEKREPPLTPKVAAIVLIALVLVIVSYYSFGRTDTSISPTAAKVASTVIAIDGGLAVVDAEVPPKTFHMSITAFPRTTSIELDTKLVATGEYSAILDSSDHELRLSAEGYVPQRFTVSPLHPAPKVVRLELDEAKRRPRTKIEEKQKETKTMAPVRKTKPFGSDNLNPWESK